MSLFTYMLARLHGRSGISHKTVAIEDQKEGREGTCQGHRLRDIHDIIEKRTINIEGHVYAPFYFIS